MAKKTASKKTGAGGNSSARLVAIRAQQNNRPIEKIIARSVGPTLVRMAKHWGYILRVRTRWAGDQDMRDYFAEKAVSDFAELGLTREDIQKFALCRHIEVELYEAASTSAATAEMMEAASELSWEYLLSAATRNVGRFQSLLVTRCLSNGSTIRPSAPKRVLVVESAPGRIEQHYEFSDEEKRLSAAINLREDEGLAFSRTDTFSKLKATIGSQAWEAIHVTGVDTHQVAWLIEGFYDTAARKSEVIDPADHLSDGMILRGDHDSELPVPYHELASLLGVSRRPPYIVTLNLYYSGARTARDLVRRGAYAALGFLDEIDDEFAELFFQAFYWEWCRNGESIPDAFLGAWSQMDSDRLHGTGIVIWLGRSMTGESGTSAKKPQTRKPAARK